MTDINEFDYTLPPELIAYYPPEKRGDSRLMVIDRHTGAIQHQHFHTLIQALQPGDLLVMNDSKVLAARLLGHKPTGGKVEILIERITDSQHALAHLKSNKPLKPGSTIIFDNHPAVITVADKQSHLYTLNFSQCEGVLAVTERIGHIPLPPYIARPDEAADAERYQTVYAQSLGSVAAPTAGLHFNTQHLEQLHQKGMNTATITLHVGAGTFQPVRTQRIEEHTMHSEWLEVSASVCEQIKQCKQRGNRVIAVGTTSVRSLETASLSGTIQPYTGETDIFIFPGFRFQVIDGLITNFHLPKSTLLMLVSALAGKDLMFKAYETAIEQRYRFFSYGDAMLIL